MIVPMRRHNAKCNVCGSKISCIVLSDVCRPAQLLIRNTHLGNTLIFGIYDLLLRSYLGEKLLLTMYHLCLTPQQHFQRSGFFFPLKTFSTKTHIRFFDCLKFAFCLCGKLCLAHRRVPFLTVLLKCTLRITAKRKERGAEVCSSLLGWWSGFGDRV